jgi:hypothetical protein
VPLTVYLVTILQSGQNGKKNLSDIRNQKKAFQAHTTEKTLSKKDGGARPRSPPHKFVQQKKFKRRQ